MTSNGNRVHYFVAPNPGEGPTHAWRVLRDTHTIVACATEASACEFAIARARSEATTGKLPQVHVRHDGAVSTIWHRDDDAPAFPESNRADRR